MSRSLTPILMIALAAQPLLVGMAFAQGPGGGPGGSPGGRGADFGRGPGRFGPTSRVVTPPPLSDQDAALMAVERREAVPLERIVETLRRTVPGQVVDAALIRQHGTLYYRLTVLEPSGDVREAYFIARTGQPVEAP